MAVIRTPDTCTKAVYIDACEYLTPTEARAIATKLQQLADQHDKQRTTYTAKDTTGDDIEGRIISTTSRTDGTVSRIRLACFDQNTDKPAVMILDRDGALALAQALTRLAHTPPTTDDTKPTHDTRVIDGAIRCTCIPGKQVPFGAGYGHLAQVRAEEHQIDSEKYPLTNWNLTSIKDIDNA